MTQLAQIPHTREEATALFLPWASFSPFPVTTQRAASAPYLYSINLDSARESLVFDIAAVHDASRLFDRSGQVFSVQQRVTALMLGWDESLFNTAPEELKRTLIEINEMALWGNDPADEGDLRPEPDALAHAKTWIAGFYGAISAAGYQWIKPNVTVGELGEAVLSWKIENKRLIVYISRDAAEYIQAWGPDTDTEMRDGSAASPDICRSLWSWLVG